MVNTENWEKSVIRKLSEGEKITSLGRNHPQGLNIYQQPNYRVYEFTPNKKLDGDRRYLVAGPEWSVMQQLSLLKVEHDMLGDRLGFLFNFEEFWDIWEKGGLQFINRTGTPGLRTNYPSSDRTNPDESVTPGWRKEVDNRPGFQEWKNPNLKANPKARVIEYWPDRSQGDTSFVLMGSDRDIIQAILAMEWEGGGAIAQEDDFIGGGFPKRMGQPQVTLYFQEDKEDVEPGWKPVKGTIAFRLMNITDNPDDARDNITWGFIEKLAKDIHKEFALPNDSKGYVWRKGKSYFNYHCWDLGYGFQILCRNVNEGQEIVEKVLKIRGHTFDKTKASQSSNLDETNAYPVIPPKVNILGREVRQRRKRPIADVRFRAARLILPRWDTPIPLVRNGTVETFLTDGREGELG